MQLELAANKHVRQALIDSRLVVRYNYNLHSYQKTMHANMSMSQHSTHRALGEERNHILGISARCTAVIIESMNACMAEVKSAT